LVTGVLEMPKTEDVTEETTSGESHVFETQGGEETIAVGREIAKLLAPPKFLILQGDLGAGKTTLVKGIAEGLNAAEAEEVTSPTFTLIHEYEGEFTAKGKKTPVVLYHLDLYRIDGERQLESLGLDELAKPDSIVLVEWGEKFPSVVKRSDGQIIVKSTGGDARKITVNLR
jgi:tRNA threonylcarbamoyladenosine biosynthesis protein TsaE